MTATLFARLAEEIDAADLTAGDVVAWQRAVALAESFRLRGLCPAAPDTPAHAAIYTFACTCPDCGGPLEHLVSYPAVDDPATRLAAIALCAPCDRSYKLTVRLTGHA